MQFWYESKLFVEHSLPIEHGTLHVIVGFLAWMTLASLLRCPLSSWRPWLGLLAAIGWNEFVDLWVERWPHPGMQYGEGMRDLAITMLLPSVVMVAVRRLPLLFGAGQDAAPSD